MKDALPLIGVVIGALLSAGLSVWHDRRRWARDDDLRRRDHDREDRHRWLADRRQLYAHYIAALNQAESAGRKTQHGHVFARIADNGGQRDRAADALDEAAGTWESYVLASIELQRLTVELELIATPMVADLARELTNATRGLIDRLVRGRSRT